MIKVIRQFYKLSEKKTYLPGETLNLSKQDEADVVANGFAEYVKEDKRKKVKIDKK